MGRMNQSRVGGIAAVLLSLLLIMSVGSSSATPADVRTMDNDVDLRPFFEKYRLPSRLQGTRGTCSVFVVTQALEYALANSTGRSTQLSVEYLNWASNQATRQIRDGGFFSYLWRGFETWGICP